MSVWFLPAVKTPIRSSSSSAVKLASNHPCDGRLTWKVKCHCLFFYSVTMFLYFINVQYCTWYCLITVQYCTTVYFCGCFTLIVYYTTVLGWVVTKLSLFITTMCIIIVFFLILLTSHCLFRCVSLNMCL